MTQAPEGLHAVQYAREILEETLGWPSKGNLELVADCLTSIAKSKQFSLTKAHGYLKRAVTLAREQGIEVNHFFFSNGTYMNIRPNGRLAPKWQPEDRKAFEEHIKTPEYQQAKDDMLAAFRKLAKNEKYVTKRAGQ